MLLLISAPVHFFPIASTMMALAILCFVALAPVSEAHLMMSHPAPRHSINNPGPNGHIDYSYTAPLGAYPCKGYPPQRPVMTVRAGDTIPVTISGSVTHDGGHCQFALSYDGDRNFVVIQTIIRQCFRSGNGALHLSCHHSAGCAAGLATLSWSWINAIGNREYYQSCSDIVITGGSGPSGTMSGPQLLVAHLPGFPLHFPEFPGDSDDKREFFNRRPQITVRGNTNSGNWASLPGPSPPPQQPTNPPSGSQGTVPRCQHGQQRCINNGNGLSKCSNGVWYDYGVPRGTKCAIVNGAVELVLA
ncbi:hypothetical protein BCR44DRAFT_52168, partial [Catenaria anguillulae PL171]